MSRHAKRGKRRAAPPARPVPAPPPRPARSTRLAARTARGKPAEERPKAPWHPVPLAELCVLVGIILIVAGLITGVSGDRGRLLLVTGLALGSLGGLDTSAREHFSGWASHTAVLAGVPAVAVAAVLFFAKAPWAAVVAAMVIVFAAAGIALDRTWRRRAGY
ncbi:MAG: hypothetical protein QOK21_1336 [Solirubrobacteraceae bacterium]|jgi:hypothetical protein|nr:hypothetical protein [Solirubrobacteraceae bacterium]